MPQGFLTKFKNIVFASVKFSGFLIMRKSGRAPPCACPIDVGTYSSIIMFSDYVISVNKYLLGFISIGLAFFYFIAIPTVIRSRLTTDTSAMTSFVDTEAVFLKKLDGNAVLVDVNENKIRVESDIEKKYIEGNSYKIQENDGNLTI